jgi:hypothetical protein
MSINRNQKAYIRIDGSGRDVAGSLILRNKKPGNGKWREVLTYEYCNLTTTTTTANPAVVGTFKSGGIIASTSVIDNQVMVVSLEDLGNLTWWNGSNVTTGATATGLKTGSDNTDVIISTQGAGTYAATETRDNILPYGLPSKDELNELFVNLAAINAGLANNGGTQIPTSFHWSSTEVLIGTASLQSFSNGSQASSNKSVPTRVRAVRWVNI